MSRRDRDRNARAEIRAGVVVFAILSAVAGCRGAKDTIVARGGDWQITRAELAADYDRLYGPGTFDRAEPARREQFLTAAVNTKLLVGLAHREVPQLTPEGERRIRVGIDDRLLPAYRQARWQSWRPDPARLTEARQALAREAHLLAIAVGRASVADTCAAALRAGLSFEAAWQRFGRRWPELREMDQGWRDPLSLPPRVMRAVFLDPLPPDSLTEPVATRHSVWIVKVLAYRPFDFGARSGYAPRIEAMLERMLYRDARLAARDSLTQAFGLRLFPETCPMVADAVQAYLDSVSAARAPGTSTGQWSLRAPSWRLNPADRRRPLALWEGDTLTAAEFMRTLDEIDVRHWPHLGPAERQVRETQERLVRLMLATDARRRGIDTGAGFAPAAQRMRDAIRLDEYHDRVLLPQVAVTASEIDSLYAIDPGRWQVPERIEFSAVFFPDEDEDVAEEFLHSVRGGDGRLWTERATEAAAAADRAHFMATSEMLDVGRVPEPPSWEPMQRLAETLAVGEIAGPVRLPELDSVAIVRLIERLPPQPLTPSAARVMVEREVRLQKVEALLGRVLAAERERQGVKAWPGRLAPRGGNSR